MKILLTLVLFTFLFIQVYGQVENRTHYNIQEYVEIGLSIIEAADIALIIDHIPLASEMYYEGYVYKDSVGVFHMMLARFPYKDIREIICHEMIHIQQMHNKELMIFDYNTVIYKSKVIHLYKTPWSLRQYEIDAVKGSIWLSSIIAAIVK